MSCSLLSRPLSRILRLSSASCGSRSALYYSSDGPSSSPSVRDRISGLVGESKVVVFMKGVPEQPRCGFSNAVVQILRMHDVRFSAHDVLQDEELRQGKDESNFILKMKKIIIRDSQIDLDGDDHVQGIKEFSDWPTIPQVYLQGEFVGGCDILLQMHQNGELVEELQKAGIKSALLAAEQEEEEEEEGGKDRGKKDTDT